MSGNAALNVDEIEEISSLDAVLDRIDEIRAQAQKSSRYGFDLPWHVFIRRMRCLTPQSYGTRIQNRLAEHFGWTVVKASLDRGDVVDEAGQYQEIKVTLITASNKGTNFVQIRPYQDIAGYHCFVVEPDYGVVHFWLSKEQMAAEVALIGSNAHGTKGAAQANENREHAIRFPWTPDVVGSAAARWVASYTLPAPQLG